MPLCHARLHRMTTLAQIEEMALRLPGTVAVYGAQFAVSVEHRGKRRGFLWTWLERVEPKKPRVPNMSVVALAVPNLGVKEMILQSDPEKFFTEPHYDGYAAVLVRLEAISPEELEPLLIEAWKCRAPAKAVREFEAAE